jgi:hypothetical protein
MFAMVSQLGRFFASGGREILPAGGERFYFADGAVKSKSSKRQISSQRFTGLTW